MGKVHDKIVKTVPNGEVIASVISCNYLITAGVSDWAGYAIAAGLFITRQCPVHDRFRRFGIKSDEEIPSFVELFLNDELVSKTLQFNKCEASFEKQLSKHLLSNFESFQKKSSWN